MRTLIYVPVIHTSADLGSIAEHVAKKGISDLGQELWEKHKRTVEGFWDAVSDYFESMDVTGVKIYQDGMVADDEVGRKIVEDTARAGSKNYQLILRLLDRGAVLIKTEDLSLVRKEYDRLKAIVRAPSITRKLIAFVKYRLIRTALLNKRDAFIAETIEQTLRAGEKGILFIGAFHRVKKKLTGGSRPSPSAPTSAPVRVIEIKEAAKVKKYQELLPFYRKRQRLFDELGAYLIAEIK
jgi:hypothetical protein